MPSMTDDLARLRRDVGYLRGEQVDAMLDVIAAADKLPRWHYNTCEMEIGSCVCPRKNCDAARARLAVLMR